MNAATSGATAVLTVVYDLRDPDSWDVACRHARMWGRLYCQIEPLDPDHIAALFNPAPDPRWQAWEAERLRWLREELAA